jgi:hypothetical protein
MRGADYPEFCGRGDALWVGSIDAKPGMKVLS